VNNYRKRLLTFTCIVFGLMLLVIDVDIEYRQVIRGHLSTTNVSCKRGGGGVLVISALNWDQLHYISKYLISTEKYEEFF